MTLNVDVQIKTLCAEGVFEIGFEGMKIGS